METTRKKALPFLRQCVDGISIVTLLLAVGCQHAAPGPADIEPGDICASCKMAISEKRYAAELIDRDGELLRFDDIGCMLRWVEGQPHEATAYFVADFDSRKWVRAEEAYYVRSPELKTPMSGIVAFQDASSAEAAAARYHGDRLRLTDLLGR